MVSGQVNPEFAFINAAGVSPGQSRHRLARRRWHWCPDACRLRESETQNTTCLPLAPTLLSRAQVLGLLQLQLAAHKALTNSSRGRLVTKTLHAELVYNLSGSKHVR